MGAWDGFMGTDKLSVSAFEDGGGAAGGRAARDRGGAAGGKVDEGQFREAGGGAERERQGEEGLLHGMGKGGGVTACQSEEGRETPPRVRGWPRKTPNAAPWRGPARDYAEGSLTSTAAAALASFGTA